jgi:hypothetical protein
LLTPLTKSWCTDMGSELTSVGLQIHGGMGYIEETGAAQHFRDARIAPIYEGTNGIQAIDLVGRKLPLRGGAAIRDHLAAMAATGDAIAADADLATVHAHLTAAVDATTEATEWLLATGPDHPNAVLAGAGPYLEMLATTTAAAALVDGVLSARAHHDAPSVVSEQCVLTRFFGSNRLATVPGRLAAVTESAADIEAASATVLAP